MFAVFAFFLAYLLFVNITIISKILTNLKTDAFEVIASRLLFFKL